MATRRRKEFGNHIVSDPEICGGDLTFIAEAINLAQRGVTATCRS